MTFFFLPRGIARLLAGYAMLFFEAAGVVVFFFICLLARRAMLLF